MMNETLTRKYSSERSVIIDIENNNKLVIPESISEAPKGYLSIREVIASGGSSDSVLRRLLSDGVLVSTKEILTQ